MTEPIERTAEAQLSRIEMLIADLGTSSPMDRIAGYTRVVEAQLTLNVMLLNRIRGLESGIAYANELLMKSGKGQPQQRRKGTNHDGNTRDL